MSKRKVARRSIHSKSHRTRSSKQAADFLRERQVPPQTVQTAFDLQRTIGNRTTAKLLQRQNEKGSATVVGTTSSEELAADESSFTQGLVGDEDIYEDPKESLEDKVITAHRFETPHPSIAQWESALKRSRARN